MLSEFKLERYFEKWEFRARYHMTASDAQTMSVRQLLELAEDPERAAWEAMQLGYSEVAGSPELRAAIAATYDRCGPDDIVCFAGAQEGLWCVFQAILEPGDHAIVTVPNYQSMESVPLSICDVTGVSLRESHNWSLDLQEVRTAMSLQTRLIGVNFPNNPTGAVADAPTYEGLVSIAADAGIYLLNDEVYRGIEGDSDHRLPQVADVYERGVSLGVLSKAYGLPGLRVGWIACRDRELLDRIRGLKVYLSICNPVPSEVLGRIALKARETILQRNAMIVRANLRALRAFFAKYPQFFDWYEPQGGCVAFQRYLGAEGVESFCKRLVEDHGVLLLPASLFQSELRRVPTDRFRIGFGRTTMQPGLMALEAALVASA